MQTVKLSQIVVDENQPRKYFNAEKLKNLSKSIKQFGIKQPLIVQEVGKDKYLLEDGERRFRAAGMIGLKEVPVIVEKVTNDTERLVRQFNIQEQHEAWTPVEKAISVARLAEQMNLAIPAVCDLLNVTVADKARYIAFANIVNKEQWVKNEIPLDYAAGISSLKYNMRKISERELEQEFTRADEKTLENRIIKLIKSGDIIRRSDVTHLKDAFAKDPKAIKKFLETDVTPSSLYVSTKAKGAYHLRNAAANAAYIVMHANDFMKLRDVKITPAQVITFKRAIDSLEELIKIAE